MSLAGVILAAGESRRMGTPKALLEFDGETLLDRQILNLGQSCSPVIVVLGAEVQKIQSTVRLAGQATFVPNPDYTRGQLSSLQCGLAVVPKEAEGVLFTPVDYPAVRPSTVARIARRFQERTPQELVVVPRSKERHGHPVCVARALVPELLALPLEGQARDVIRRHRDQTVYVDVDDEGILQDVDEPEGFRRLKDDARLSF